MHCGKFCSIDEFDCCTVIKRELLFLFLFAVILFSPLLPSLSVGEYLTGQIPMAPIFSVLTQLFWTNLRWGKVFASVEGGKYHRAKIPLCISCGIILQVWDQESCPVWCCICCVSVLHVFRLRCLVYLWCLLSYSGTWIPGCVQVYTLILLYCIYE